MGDVRTGIYEHLVTAELAEHLSTTDASLVQLAALDPGEAHEALTRHVTGLVSRALRIAGGDDQAGVARQIDLANSIIKAVGALSPAAAGEDSITEPRRSVLAVVAAPATPGRGTPPGPTAPPGPWGHCPLRRRARSRSRAVGVLCSRWWRLPPRQVRSRSPNDPRCRCPRAPCLSMAAASPASATKSTGSWCR